MQTVQRPTYVNVAILFVAAPAWTVPVIFTRSSPSESRA
jgi:hypothetical protein